MSQSRLPTNAMQIMIVMMFCFWSSCEKKQRSTPTKKESIQKTKSIENGKVLSNKILSFNDCQKFESWLKAQPFEFFQPSGGVNLSKLGLGIGEILNREVQKGKRLDVKTNFKSQPGGAGPSSPKTYGLDDVDSSNTISARYVRRKNINFAGTKNHIANDDESDFVKTDGRYLYQIAGGTLHIVKVWPAEKATEVSVVKLPSELKSLVLLPNKELMVFSTKSPNLIDVKTGKGSRAGSPTTNFDLSATEVTIFDVSRPEALAFKRKFDIRGEMKSARLLPDGTVVIISTSGLSRSDEFDSLKFKAWLKSWSLNDFLGAKSSHLGNQCKNIYLAGSDSFSLVNLSRIDPKTTSLSESLIFGEYEHLVVSDNSIYFSKTKHKNSPGIFSKSTNVLKVQIPNQGSLRPVANGWFSGQLIDNFAIDEYQGYLRLALSGILLKSKEDKNEVTESRVVVLKTSGDSLIEIGRSPSIAPGEPLKSVRFADHMGYVITYRDVDPLLVLDLSKAEAPQLEGTLKVPGNSTYIHPIDNDRLLTIECETNLKTGCATEIKMSVFNVKNRKAPALIDSLVSKSSKRSRSIYDLLALTYNPKHKQLLIPWVADENMDVKYKMSNKKFQRNYGLSAFNIGTSHVQFRGDLSMSSNEYNYQINRHIMIENYLFALSETEIKVAKKDNVSKVIKTVSFEK